MANPLRVRNNESFLKSKLFWGVLAFKIICLFFFASAYLKELFLPFINYFVLSGFKNPWEFFYAQHLTKMYPYPTVMLILMSIPRVLFSWILPNQWQAVAPMHLFVMRTPLLFFDVFLLFLLSYFYPTQKKKLLLIYWCSPIIFFINYIHGQLDIIPTAIFFLSMILLVNEKYLYASVTLAVAMAAKTHILIAVPFVFVYMYRQKILTRLVFFYFTVFVLSYGLLISHYIFSEGFRQMVFHTPEQKRLFEFTLPVSTSLNILVCPAIAVLVFIKYVSYRKLNREIIFMFIGIVFAALVIFVDPM